MYQGDAIAPVPTPPAVRDCSAWRRSRACRSAQRSSVGAAPLGERDIDRVEVPRRLGPREHRACLVAQLAAGVARRDVGQGEQPHIGVPGGFRGLPGGAVERLGRPLELLVQERRLVDEHVGLMSGDRERLAGRGVA